MPGSESTPTMEAPRLRLLLAEDDDVNALVATTILTRAGHEVVRASNGREALDALRGECFDVALIDVRMPELDGLEVIARFRASEAPSRRAPIIALTANAMDGDAEACIDAGADAYVPKPIDRVSLKSTVERMADTIPTFDREGFVARMAGDASIARDVAATFLSAWPALAGSLGAAGSEAEAFVRAAASIRDSVELVGGARARDRAYNLHRAAVRGDVRSAGAWVSPALEAGDALVVALQAFVAER